MSAEFYKNVAAVQKAIKAPKNQLNKFGGYNYRSCEDILHAAKLIFSEYELILLITDDVVTIGDRFYIKATAIITDGDNTISAIGYARESLQKKGMDDAQVTGSTSSYARKYALNGLFAIDDSKDIDGSDSPKQPQTPQQPAKQTPQQPAKPRPLSDKQHKFIEATLSEYHIDRNSFKTMIAVDSMNDITTVQFTDVKNKLLDECKLTVEMAIDEADNVGALEQWDERLRKLSIAKHAKAPELREKYAIRMRELAKDHPDG